MKTLNISLPSIFALLWIFLLITMYWFKVPHHFVVGIFLNILFILLSAFFSMHVQIKSENKLHPFVYNLKNCLKGSGKYLIIVFSFLFIYLKFINPEFLKKRQEQLYEYALKNQTFESVQEQLPQYKNLTYEDYKADLAESFEGIGSISFNLSLYLLGMFFLALLFSVLIPIIYQKLILRM